MAIQPMALQVKDREIDGVGEFAKGAGTSMQLEGMKREQADAGIRQIAKIALGSMGGKLDGEVNPQFFEQGLDLLASHNVDVSKFRGHPELAPLVARASLDTMQQLKLAQDDRDYQMRIKEFGLRVSNAARSAAEAKAPGNVEAGLNPIWFRDTETGRDVLGQSVKSGGYLINGEVYQSLPENLQPLAPVQQLNTGTGFTGVTKFGDAKGETVSIDNYTPKFDETVAGVEGKRAGELPVLKSKAQTALNGFERQKETVVSNIDKAVGQVTSNPGLMSGFAGDMLSGVKGTPQYDLSQTLGTIRANIGFDRLQEMRDNSPTGGALGQVSEKENELLQAVQGALSQGQTAGQLIDNLNRIKELQDTVLADRKAAFERDFSGAAKPGKASDEVIDWTDL
jgi:hypothetical protein